MLTMWNKLNLGCFRREGWHTKKKKKIIDDRIEKFEIVTRGAQRKKRSENKELNIVLSIQEC